MSLFPFLYFFSTLVYLYLAGLILVKNRGPLPNRIASGFLIILAWWSFALVFVHNPYVSKETAHIAINIGSPGWIGLGSMFLWFIIAFTGKGAILKKWWFCLLLIVFPVFFIYMQLTGHIFSDYILKFYGWKPLYSKEIWAYLFAFYNTVFGLVGVFLLFRYMKAVQNPFLKKQARVILISASIIIGVGGVTDCVLPLVEIHVIPNLANFSALVWAVGTGIGMVKYKLLIINPAAAADNIISTMFDCLILLNLEGDIVSVNKAAISLLGYKNEELKGSSIRIILMKQPLMYEIIKRTVLNGMIRNKEIAFKSKIGRKIPVIISSSLLRDEIGNPAGFVLTAMDISQRKRLESEIIKIKKLESLGILAGGIAHDFNNLLSVVMGNLNLALGTMLPDDRAYKFISKAEKAAMKATELSRKFLTFSPGGWIKKEKHSLSEILGSAKEITASNISIVYDIYIPPDVSPIHADFEQILQVFQNIFINSMEAMPDGGTIAVRATNETLDSRNMYMLKGGNYVKMTITDTGCGIPKAHLTKVFDPYFSTKNKMNQKGMGLGLSICFSIIKKHDGHIIIESDQGVGTTVVIYLPVFEKE